MSDHKPINSTVGLVNFVELCFGAVMLCSMFLTVATPVVTLCYQALLWFKHGRWITLPILETLNWILDKLDTGVTLRVPYQNTDWVGAARLVRSACEADTWFSFVIIFSVVNLILLWLSKLFEDLVREIKQIEHAAKKIREAGREKPQG
jgi:hypothetical protein